jgi:4-hydroxybutyryl-CoA dehydratase/vinylacetyl-CoA-Delta-isomerase
VAAHALGFDAAATPEEKDIFMIKSAFTGKEVMRQNTLMTSLDEIMANSKVKRTMFRKAGTCTGGFCVGWNAQTILWAVTSEIDAEFGTDYQKRLEKWLLKAQDQGLLVAGALTDAKGDRSKRPSQNSNLDANLRITKYRDDGIEITGCKAMITGVASSDEVFLLPGGGYREDDKDYAVSCVVPRDIEGLTLVECRAASDSRNYEEGWDNPATGATASYLIFENCFVPKERVFMEGQYKYSGNAITYFTANYRACIGACVAGQIMIGAAINMARANGLSQKTFQSTLNDMAINNEITYGLGVGAMMLGRKHPSGIWIPNDLLAHTNKTQVAKLPYRTKVMAQDISGGIAETGCMPSYADLKSPLYGEKLLKTLTAGSDGESRAKMARLVEWLTVGGGIPGCMHGGGSPDGAKLVVRGLTKWEDYAKMAKKIMDVDDDKIVEPAPKK